MKVDMYMTPSHMEFMSFSKVSVYMNYIGKNMLIFTDKKISNAILSKTGFTILELIVSITILTLVALIIGQGFRIGVNSWEKGEAETVETQQLRILSGMLTQQLKSFYLYRTKLDDEVEESILFKGEADSILFVTTLADSSYGGLKWVSYSYEEGILYYKEGLLPDKDVMENIEGNEEVLASDIEEVVFEYYVGYEDEWNDSWENEDAVPDAVRVKLSYFQPFRINLMHGSSMKKKEDQN
jgi:prepilin-type N-terminal cleavage/methylation domain-containing protein